MRKAFFATLLLAACAATSFAQDAEYKKGEVFVGYSANEVDTNGAFSPTGDNDREHFNGINVEATHNLTRFFGIQGDFSYHQKDKDFNVAGTNVSLRARLSQFMGGVKVQDNADETRFRPFAHALVGVAHASGEFTAPGVSDSDSDNGLAVAIGGGIDFRVHPNVDVRAIQVDYNPNRFNGETDHNFRIGVGLNFRF